MLFRSNADVALADRHGSTALMEAARAGAVGIVQLLAEAQPDARVRDSHGRDALTLACQSAHAHADTVRALLTLGAEAKTPGSDGRSALDHAAAAGRWDLVALLDPDTPLPASLEPDAVLAEEERRELVVAHAAVAVPVDLRHRRRHHPRHRRCCSRFR